MSEQLRNMLVVAGVLTLAGGAFTLYTPQPSTRTMAELRDAGVADGQKFVLVRAEKLTDVSRRRINRTQPGLLRTNQIYATVARVAVCRRGDGQLTNCFDVDGNLRVNASDGGVIVPSLRIDADGGSEDGADDGAGESNEVDDAKPSEQTQQAITCASFDAGVPSPFATPFCSRLNRMMVVPSGCVIPNCWTLPDGGWNDDTVADCRTTAASPWGDRYLGCNTIPGQYAVGTQCVPVNCATVGGDIAPDYL